LLELEPDAAVVVLTGDANEYLGELAVRAGAQDYLVKGEVAGHTLHRVIRYAVERGARRRRSGSCIRHSSTPRRTPGSSAACCRRRCLATRG